MEFTAGVQIAKIKKRVFILHIIIITLLALDALVWIFFIIFDRDAPISLIVGLSCFNFLIILVLKGALIERLLKRDLKKCVEKYAGVVTLEDKASATTLLKKWKKILISTEFKEALKISYLTGREKYPFGNQIIEDLIAVKKGIKVETKEFYSLITKYDFEGESNKLISEICSLINKNSYALNK